ncbi:MAG: hypothetical protein U1A24_16225 [Cypionkella sp.]|uniref:hypothetical protein n=1 Tax=Cypionkella sp. TaxID=2811411 RepID=UPI002ABC9A63|nr:hypothetical protein [Cypionkella sp.]MDZ4312095.1 hypothetical protein [Cypionkella sp.]
MPQRKSIPFEMFPRKFKMAINGMKNPRRGRKRYSETSIRSVINAVGQYLYVLGRAGLPPELSYDGLGAFVDYLDGSGLRNSTCLSYMAGVQAVAKEVKYPATARRVILGDCAFYRDAFKLEVPTKIRKLAANPITLADIGRAAVKAREQAYDAATTTRRRTLFIRSGVLALLSLLPARIGDVTRLEIGKGISRQDGQWRLQMTSGKTGYRHNGPLHDSLTRYLDDLIMFGTKGSIEFHYAQRMGTPLFSTELGEFLSPRTLPYNFKAATGHTPHIVRTLVHDALAEHGTYGADLARILCGQTSVEIAKIYEVHAARFRAQKGQKILAEIHLKALQKPSSISIGGARI